MAVTSHPWPIVVGVDGSAVSAADVSAARTAELLVVGRCAPDGSRQVGSAGVVTARAGAAVLVVPVPSGQPSLDREWARRHAVVLAR